MDPGAKGGYTDEMHYYIMLWMSRISAEDVSLKSTTTCYNVLLLCQHISIALPVLTCESLQQSYGTFYHRHHYFANKEAPPMEDKKLFHLFFFAGGLSKHKITKNMTFILDPSRDNHC